MVDFLPVRKARIEEIREENQRDGAIETFEMVILNG